jgi:hypothetical protein
MHKGFQLSMCNIEGEIIVRCSIKCKVVAHPAHN